ncbi:MAG: glycosyltransferase family 4 protein [Patescibacteria group bacterium]
MNKLRDIYSAYKNKITNKLWGIVHMKAEGRKKGDILISYITEPFTLAPWESFSNFHTNTWECYEIARLFSEKGYSVDIINASNHTFIPKKPYVVCFDSDNNLERFLPHLPKECKTVFPILISHWKAYNDAEESRLDALEQRRGVRLLPRRKMLPSRNAELTDYLEGFGNKTIFNTFKQFNKPIFFIPISVVVQFDFPKDKDFEKARKHFLWVGGGGAVLKGLDIALEAFSLTPDLHLHVCGPIYAEKDFVEEYKKELEETANIHVYGRIDVGGEQFASILNTCAAVVYPSFGEGSSGAVVQAMHAGLIPIITHETGIQETAGYIPLENPTPESIMQKVQEFSNMPEEKVREFSKKIWKYAREHYTRESFSTAYKHFIEEILKL